MDKNLLKKELNRLNIPVFGNHVRKSDVKKIIAASLYDALKVNENKEWVVYELPCKEGMYKGINTYDAFVWLCEGTKWQNSAYEQFKSMGNKTLYIFVSKTKDKKDPLWKIGTDEREDVYVDAVEQQVQDVSVLDLPALKQTAAPVTDQCTCDIYELMRNGCKCGAVQKLKEKGQFFHKDLAKAALEKGDILRAKHGTLESNPVTFVYLKNEEIQKKLEDHPKVLEKGKDGDEPWLAIPRELRLTDFIKHAATANVKKQLKSLGISVIGNYVRKEDVRKFFESRKRIKSSRASEFSKISDRLENEDEAELGDIKGTEPGEKDIVRLEDIKRKGAGDKNKVLQLVKNMANAISRGGGGSSRDKAVRRAKAAEKVFPGQFGKELSKIFMDVA